MSLNVNASQKPNHLIHEKSPYLQQHALNPVDWYPWGQAAFDKAKKENKPLLISIGYSTCHWCHVMERESFENAATAELMNKYFVCVKVDREERPDVDKIYMTAVTAMTGQGGWPLNVFVTPDLKPFFGGTYFPPEAKWGHPSWTEVLTQLSNAWLDPKENAYMAEIGQKMAEALRDHAAAPASPETKDARWLQKAYLDLKSAYDPDRGGFGKAPKFPMPGYHTFLLRYAAREKEKQAMAMSLTSLRRMAEGGIYDHLGGGFSRYSTDAHWHIPHFEKMLYDNAQLAVNYLEAYQVSREDLFKNVARETLEYLLRDLRHPGGAFYSAEDADSEGREGAFYVWTHADISQALTPPLADWFSFRYGVREKGNAASDPHGDFNEKNILYAAHSLAETARTFKASQAVVEARLSEARKILFDLRAKRPRPHRDEKILTSWNGLAISAFAQAAQILGDKKDLLTAQTAARFLEKNLWDSKTKVLFRRWKDGERGIPGVAEDYAFLIRGLLDLYETDFDTQWLVWSMALSESLQNQFWDVSRGGYYMTPANGDPHLLNRVREDQDHVEPAASSVQALNLLRLSQLTGRKEYAEWGEQSIQAFGATLKHSPQAMPVMLSALHWALTEPKQIVIAGQVGAPDTEALLNEIHRHFLPAKSLILVDGGKNQAWFSQRLDYVRTMSTTEQKATAYVCEKRVCKKPTTDPKELEQLLR